MKRILLSTAFVLGTAGFAAAQDVADDQLRALVSQELDAYGTDIEVDQLTDEQVSELYLYATSTDSTSVKHDNYRRILDPYLGDEGTPYRTRTRAYTAAGEGMPETDLEPVGVTLPRYQLRSLVEQMLETYEIEVDVSQLTDEQLAELYLIDTSTDSESVEEDRIRAVLGLEE